FFFSRRRRHTRFSRDWSSDVCSSDLTCLPAKYRDCRPAAPATPRPGTGLLTPTPPGGDVPAAGAAGTSASGGLLPVLIGAQHVQIGRASCRERSARADVGGICEE